MVEGGELSAGHARAIVALPGAKAQLSCARKVLALRLSVRQTEALVKKLQTPQKTQTKKTDESIYVKALEERLTRSFNRKVHIVSGPRKGRLEIEYYGNEDLDALIRALQPLAGDGETEDNA